MSGQERAEAMVERACRWVSANPEKWDALRGLCRRLAVEGEVIQRGNVYEQARRRGVDVTLAGAFRRDHNLWSALARYMVMEDPRLLAAVRFRETPIDEVDMVAAWREVVGEGRFAASSLAEARAMWDGMRGAA